MLLREGARGSEVVQWQNALRAAGYTGVKPSGLFDPLTTAATRDFQLRARIRVDGIVGPESWLAANTAALSASGNGTRTATRKATPTASPAAVAAPASCLPSWLVIAALGGALYFGLESFRGKS